MFFKFKWISGRIWNWDGGKCFQWHDPLHHTFFDLPLLHRTSWVGNSFSVMEIPDMLMQDLVSRLLTSHWSKKSVNYHWLNSGGVSLMNIRQHLTLEVSQILFVWCWIFRTCSHKKYQNGLHVAPWTRIQVSLYHHFKFSVTHPSSH
jgi:hypothetical protein